MSQALLQMSLDQTIGREDLEEASVAAPSIARGDCARLRREMLGVVAENLPEDEARAFQQALRLCGFSTKRVPQHHLPRLAEPVKRAGVRFVEKGISVIDGMRRETCYPWKDVHFAAGGFVETVASRTERTFEWQYQYVGYGPRGGVRRKVGVGERDRLEREQRFRLELYLGDKLERAMIELHKERFFILGDQVVRLRQQTLLQGVLRVFGEHLPYERYNQGIQAARDGAPLVYPSSRAFEREIVWHFYRLAEG